MIFPYAPHLGGAFYVTVCFSEEHSLGECFWEEPLLGGAPLGGAKEACMILYFLGHPHNVGAASAILVFLTLMRLYGTDLVLSVCTSVHTFLLLRSFRSL